MSDDFNAARKKHVKVHSHNIPPTPCCLVCREPWPCTVRLLLAKVRKQAEEIERLKQEAKRVVAVAEAAPKQSYVIDLGEIAKQDAPKQAEQPDHEFVWCPSMEPEGMPARFCVLSSPKHNECHYWYRHPARYCGLPESAHFSVRAQRANHRRAEEKRCDCGSYDAGCTHRWREKL